MPNHYNTTGSFSVRIRVNFLSSRIEYDAFRVDLEELNMGPRDAVTVPKLEQAQKDFQTQREKYEKIRDDLSVKVKLLEGNKVTILD